MCEIFKVFVYDMNTGMIEEASPGSDEYLIGMRYLMDSEDFSPEFKSTSFYHSDYPDVKYVIARTKEDALDVVEPVEEKLFDPDDPDDPVMRAFRALCEGDGEECLEILSELGDDYEIKLIQSALGGEIELNITEKPTDEEDEKT